MAENEKVARGGGQEPAVPGRTQWLSLCPGEDAVEIWDQQPQWDPTLMTYVRQEGANRASTREDVPNWMEPGDLWESGSGTHWPNGISNGAGAWTYQLFWWRRVEQHPLVGEFDDLRAELRTAQAEVERLTAALAEAEQRIRTMAHAAQVADYLSKVQDLDVRRMAVAYISSGVRRCELIALEYPRDIDMEGQRIRVVRQKKRSHIEEWVPMHPLFRAVLLSMNLKDGSRPFGKWHPDTVTHKVEESLRAAGYGHLHLHSLRHTMGAMLAMAGYSERTIADMLGHAQTSTAAIYTHATKDHLQKAVNSLNLGLVDLGKSGES